jgi:hypothetical protein
VTWDACRGDPHAWCGVWVSPRDPVEGCHRLVGPAAVGATPEASAVTRGLRNRRRRIRHGGTIPGHLTCRYMECLGCPPRRVTPSGNRGPGPRTKGPRREYGGTVSTRDDDVEEFAALLRRLKARTDRSYGALARRVNMNTSTLHRYCAGDAVPLDFAPVERFAALCGATRPERLELHRLWIRRWRHDSDRVRLMSPEGAVPVADPSPVEDPDEGPVEDRVADPVPEAEPTSAAEPEARAGTREPSTREPAGPGAATRPGTGASGRETASRSRALRTRRPTPCRPCRPSPPWLSARALTPVPAPAAPGTGGGESRSPPPWRPRCWSRWAPSPPCRTTVRPTTRPGSSARARARPRGRPPTTHVTPGPRAPPPKPPGRHRPPRLPARDGQGQAVRALRQGRRTIGEQRRAERLGLHRPAAHLDRELAGLGVRLRP